MGVKMVFVSNEVEAGAGGLEVVVAAVTSPVRRGNVRISWLYGELRIRAVAERRLAAE
jgi:hypothetical protein